MNDSGPGVVALLLPGLLLAWMVAVIYVSVNGRRNMSVKFKGLGVEFNITPLDRRAPRAPESLSE